MRLREGAATYHMIEFIENLILQEQILVWSGQHHTYNPDFHNQSYNFPHEIVNGRYQTLPYHFFMSACFVNSFSVE